MRGRPDCRRRPARATGLSPLGPPWAGAQAAWPRGWCIALCATTALGSAVPWSRVRGARGRCGGSGPELVPSFPRELLPSLASLTVRVADCPVRVSVPFARWYAIPCSLWVPRGRPGCPWAWRRVSVGCWCVRAHAAYASPPPPGYVWRAHYACFWWRALVGPFQAVRAPPSFLPLSSAPPSLIREWPAPCTPWPRSGMPPRGRACASLGVSAPGECVRDWVVRSRCPWWRGWVPVCRGVSAGGGRGFFCLGPSVCLPRTRTNAGFVGVTLYIEGVASILLRFVSVRSRLGAVRGERRGVPLCTRRWLTGRLVSWPSLQLAEVIVGTERAVERGPCGTRSPLARRGGTGPTSPNQPLALRGLGGRGGWGSRAGVVQSL